MNVLFTTNTYPPEVGGIPRSVSTTARALREWGCRVVILAPENPGASLEPDVVRVPSASFKEFSLPLLLLDRNPTLLRFGLSVSGFQPDVVHNHQPHLLGNTGQRIARHFGCPSIFTWHTQYDQHAQRIVSGPLPAAGALMTAVTFANASTAIIAPSTAIKAQLRRWGVRPSTFVLPTGIETARLGLGDRARGRARWGLSPTGPVVGVISRLSPEKNLDTLLQVFRACPAQVLVVGDGPLAAQLRQSFPQATFTGSLTGPALADAYASLDIFGFASQSETQGMVCAEALAAGVPVYALSAPGVDDVVDGSVGGRFGSAPELAAGITASLSRPDLLRAQGQAGRRRAAGLDISVTSQQLLQFYAAWCKLAAVKRRKRC